MGVVYKAHDLVLDRDVAVKFLSPKYFSGAEAAARFLREARLVARLSHPNIMSIFDVGEDQGWQYLVFEYIPGSDLHVLMSKRTEPWTTADTLPILKASLAFHLLERFGETVAPATLCQERIEHENVFFVRPAAMFEAPLENFFIGAAVERLFDDGRIFDLKKSAHARVCSRAVLVIGRQLSLRMQTNLVQHPTKEDDATDLFG